MNRHEEFLKAYDSVPSQDNEVYVPDRGSFKYAFRAAWEIKDQENKKTFNLLKESYELLEVMASIDAILCDSDASIDDIRQFTNELASVRMLIKKIGKVL